MRSLTEARPDPKAFPFLLLFPDDAPRAVAARLLARYDRDKDGKLSAEEAGLPRDAFVAAFPALPSRRFALV